VCAKVAEARSPPRRAVLASETMNRAFLIIAIPAAVVATLYLLVARYLHAQLKWLPFVGAGVAFVIAVGSVHWYRRRKARPRSG